MISYIIQVAVCWGLFYLAYTLLLRPTTFFRLNRFYLLGTLLLGLILPVLPWPTAWLWSTHLPKSPDYYLLPLLEFQGGEAATLPEITVTPEAGLAAPLPWRQWLTLGFYGLGLLFGLARLGYGLWQLRRWYQTGQAEELHSFCLVRHDQVDQPFSFFRWLFWPRHLQVSEEESHQIMEHESAHIRQWHSLDLFIAEVIRIVFWFNPLVWLYGKALRNVHEYLADAAVLRQANRKVYGHLLVRQALLGSNHTLVHNFSPAQLKKRITMMTKRKTQRIALWRYFLLTPLPILLASFLATQPTSGTDYLPTTSTVVDSIPKTLEVMPLFAPEACLDLTEAKAREKCSFQQLISFVGQNLKYPQVAKENGIEGNVVINFVVDASGQITRAKIIKDIGGGCGEEALRVVQSMPAWQPGRNGTEAAPVEMNLPIAFRLPKPEEKKEEDKRGAYASEEVLQVAEEMPVFAPEECREMADNNDRFQCGLKHLVQYIGQQLRYPAAAKENNLQGTVVVGFIIDSQGRVKEAKIVRDIGAGCGEEALRVIREMPVWQPGRQAGKAVSVELKLPIRFQLPATPEEIQAKKAQAEASDEIFTVVEKMPTYGTDCNNEMDPEKRQNCSNQALFGHILKNMRYPETARKDSLEGTVIVEFVVDKQGYVSQSKILKDIGGGCGEEVLRVVNSMARWNPGEQRGRNVNVQFRLPVRFKLADGMATAKVSKPAPAGTSTLAVSDFQLSPNPGSGIFQLRFQAAASTTTVRVYSAQGKEIFTRQLEPGNGRFATELNLNSQPAGTYLVQISQENQVLVKQLIVQ
ncbi:MAG: TonB family protein [Lewinellaceae bacterium]|nr:TonB family protein [Lewinellaceae bacterium]